MSLHVGEIHTGLLQNSAALSAGEAVSLLSLIPQHGVRTWERPIRQAASPEILTGVDCDLPADSGARVRGVGTVGTEVWITGGHLLQASSRACIVPSEHRRRVSWSHYLARPGVIESMSAPRPDDVVPGFLDAAPRARGLDVGAITDRVMDTVQGSALLDHRPPFRHARTRLRWSALAIPDGGASADSLRFTLEAENLRTVRMRASARLVSRLPELCQDLARHDWLLTALISMIDRARTGRPGKAEVVGRLRPAMDHLLHVWMPAARLPDELVSFWRELDRRAGFGRQWDSAVNRIRDQVSLAAADHLGRAAQTISLPAERAAKSR
jgi:hypothetical protein